MHQSRLMLLSQDNKHVYIMRCAGDVREDGTMDICTKLEKTGLELMR
jgi:hypothetical protein